MTGRYEIRDRNNPRARGMRYASFARARAELEHATPRDRFYLYDRHERCPLHDLYVVTVDGCPMAHGPTDMPANDDDRYRAERLAACYREISPDATVTIEYRPLVL